MDFFFTALKKGVVATLFIVFAFVATYTPQLPTSQVPEAEAGGFGGFATEVTQLLNRALLGANVVQTTITAGATSANFYLDSVLDTLGWAVAKRMVSIMVRDLINWVNSGFSGSPAFVQDFRGFLLNVADQEIGRVISELGSIGSFICSPFRLDAQVSIALQYSRSRTQQTAPTCTLSGVISNIQGFISGIDPGNGLQDWIQITSTPETYTPYGAVLSAQATARARLINAEGEEIKLLDFGDGFLSQKLCRSVSGFTGSQDCSIVKPGKIVQEALSFNLDTGRQSLVEADEINELIAALLGQLANQALSGVAGILGLSGGDGFGGYSSGPTYLDNLVNQASQQVGSSSVSNTGSGNVITDALNAENQFVSQAQQIRSRFVAFLSTATNQADIDQANVVIAQIDAATAAANANINQLNTLDTSWQTATDAQRVDLLVTYSSISPQSNTAGQQVASWTQVANRLGINLN